ncbi:hypothetical protein ACMA110817_23570 [Achromobacter marplatensis]
MAAGAHQHRDWMLGALVVGQCLAHQPHRDVFGLLFGGRRAGARPGGMEAHRRVRQRVVECRGRAVGDCARGGVAALGQQRHERPVHPIDDTRLRTEVVGQVQEIGLQLAHADIRHFQEQAHFGLAETVDGLHGVAHQEQAASIARLPAGGQRAQQVQLRLAGVLEFVDQQMADRRIQLQQQFARIIGAAQRRGRALRDLDEVDFTRIREAQAQLRHGQRQGHQLGAQHFPLRISEAGFRDVAHGVQAAHPGGLPVGRFQPRHKGFLVRALGRKAQVLVDRLTQAAGAGQQQMRHRAPLVQHLGVRR